MTSESEAPPDPSLHLYEVVRGRLPNADELMQRMVAATVGLLSGIAYADRAYGEAEENMVRDKLLALEAFSRREVTAICKVLREDIDETTHAEYWTGEFKTLTDKWQRQQFFDVLVDVAAADGVLSEAEAAFLARTATILELTDEERAASIARHGLG